MFQVGDCPAAARQLEDDVVGKIDECRTVAQGLRFDAAADALPAASLAPGLFRPQRTSKQRGKGAVVVDAALRDHPAADPDGNEARDHRTFPEGGPAEARRRARGKGRFPGGDEALSAREAPEVVGRLPAPADGACRGRDAAPFGEKPNEGALAFGRPAVAARLHRHGHEGGERLGHSTPLPRKTAIGKRKSLSCRRNLRRNRRRSSRRNGRCLRNGRSTRRCSRRRSCRRRPSSSSERQPLQSRAPVRRRP